jgi:acetamidase/formamidase
MVADEAESSARFVKRVISPRDKSSRLGRIAPITRPAIVKGAIRGDVLITLADSEKAYPLF